MKSEISMLKRRALTLFLVNLLAWSGVVVFYFVPSAGVPLLLIAILWACLWALFRPHHSPNTKP